MFKYKLDIENFLIKYKVCLCVKNDLQSIEQDVYVVTLTYKIFKTFMTIINVWNLKIRQYNAVNAFANNDINESIYYFFSKDWKELKYFCFYWKLFINWSKF